MTTMAWRMHCDEVDPTEVGRQWIDRMGWTNDRALDGDAPPIMLKDRLFIGYQEKTGVIEVISYNERAARFEFQVVTDYRAGASPEVAYARRAVCTSCHQNGAPLFSEAGWDETDTNARVADAPLQFDSLIPKIAQRFLRI